MSLFAQHGYGKANKIDRALQSNDISGVILSPKAESLDKLIAFSADLHKKYPEAKIYFDPQFYICGMQGDITAGKLIEYPYYSAGLTRANLSVPANLHTYAEGVLTTQQQLCLSDYFSPSIIFDDFDGRESQTVISLAYESIALTTAERELYISLCIHENAFRNRASMEEFLNVISLLDVKGFYIIIAHNNNTSKPTAMNSNILSNLMWFLYTLSALNDFEVIVGFSDMLSLPMAAVSNANFACGWYNNLKAFSEMNFRTSTGGRRPRKRYTSGPLMSSLLLLPEIATLNKMDLLPQVESESPFNNIIRPILNDAEWTDEISCLHNWHVINSLLKEMESQGSYANRLDYITNRIVRASETYRIINERGFQLDAKSGGSHLNAWLAAISDFRTQAGI